MTHDLSELNQYTGLFTALAAMALFFCVYILERIAKAIGLMWEDYRKVHGLDEYEKWVDHS